MEPQTQKTSAKDFFLNLGAIVALFTSVIALLNLLFTVINVAYPQITTYYYGSSASISFPLSTLIIFFPIYVLLMWLLERDYVTAPEKKNLGVRRWLTYITLFIAGLTLAGDLVTVLYYFLDGQELTAGFLMKILAVFVVILMVFMFYISDIRNKLTSMSRKAWLVGAVCLLLASIVWGFAIIGSPRSQQLIKYDSQKVSDLQNINYQVQNYYQTKGTLPDKISDLSGVNYSSIPVDSQTQKPYEYVLIGQSAKAYQLCATFNKDSKDAGVQVQTYPYMNGDTWAHPAGHYCFDESIPVSQYKNVPMVPLQ